MQYLEWYDVKGNGCYWKIDKETGDQKMIEIENGDVFYFGSEMADSFNGIYDADYLYVKVEPPVLPSRSTYAQQKEKFDVLNRYSAFPEKVEGYWRQNEQIDSIGKQGETPLPWPVVIDLVEFDKQEFINNLADLEDDKAEENRYRGISMCRLQKVSRGNVEYRFQGWRWPGGLIDYIRMGVLPSRAFYQFVMGGRAKQHTFAALPSYNRQPHEYPVPEPK